MAVRSASSAKRRVPQLLFAAAALYTCLQVPSVCAAVLPDERADALYHSYDGGGVTINGPSVLVSKQLGKSVSANAHYYVDSITGASIDVITTASPYKEKRTEEGLGFDYLHGKTTISGSYTHSGENDYTANTANFSISQSMFGDLTTVTLGYGRGWDTVGKVQSDFSAPVRRNNYRLDLSQVMTKDLVLSISYETIADEGYLHNPYRLVRYIGTSGSLCQASGYCYQPEQYPNSHTSNAAALRALYYLPYRASLSGGYRFYSDTWGVVGHTLELGYTHPFKEHWLFDVSYRYYTQTHADFYSDLFPYQDAQNYLARDKELSTFDSNSFGLGVTYEFAKNGWRFIDKGSLNLRYNYILFNYRDFRNLTVTGAAVGEEPLYNFSANVLQLFVSIWY